MSIHQETIEDHEKAYELLFKANSKLQASQDKLVKALEGANNALKLFSDKSKILRDAMQSNNEALAAAKGESE